MNSSNTEMLQGGRKADSQKTNSQEQTRNGEKETKQFRTLDNCIKCNQVVLCYMLLYKVIYIYVYARFCSFCFAFDSSCCRHLHCDRAREDSDKLKRGKSSTSWSFGCKPVQRRDMFPESKTDVFQVSSRS